MDAYQFLKSLNIDYKNYEHNAVFTCQDCEGITFDMEFIPTKNLVLQDKKKTALFLVVVPDYKRANLKEIEGILDQKHLSFASATTLQEKLNITPGSCSLLNLINLKDKSQVQVLVDAEILKNQNVGMHPNRNTATVVFNTKHIKAILNSLQIKWQEINI
ncbi:MAG: hypothetical protein FWD32_02255 [Firmicutes bacterium]|nr:hypothetical protein [Bacillota bacterium]